jgi:hypothetical protein
MASLLKLKTDIKKLKAAIASKATSGAIKTKLRGKLTTLENELDKLQPNKRKPKTTGPKSESALVRIAKKRRTNQGLSTSKSDIERDAIRPAKPAGRRTSANGNRYYEYRDNRVDTRQPPKKYRKLADGGDLGSDYRKKLENNIYKTALNKEVNGFKLVKLAWHNEGTLLWTNKQRPEIEIYATPFYTPDNDINFEEFINEEGRRREDKEFKLTGDIDKDTQYYFNYLESITKKYAKGKMADGGYMAKGGKTKDQEVVRGYFEDEAYEYGYGGKTKNRKSIKDLTIEEISSMTSVGKAGVERFSDENNLTESDLSNIMQGLGRRMISASDFATAVSGDKDNQYSKEIVDFAKSGKGYKMEHGGSVAKGNYEMLLSQAKEVMHHAEELMQVAKPDMDVEAWVVAKAERATTDLSDITHYLDGLKMAMGGMVKHNAHKVNA